MSNICLLVALTVSISGCFDSRKKSDSDLTKEPDVSGRRRDTVGIDDAAAASSTGGFWSIADSDTEATGEDDTSGLIPTEPQCVTDDDCRRVDTCCDCLALGPKDSDPVCEETECESTMCSGIAAYNYEPLCNMGRCTLNIVCDVTFATCDRQVPNCPDGELPSVTFLDACFGPCVPAEQCIVVTSCSDCREGEICVSMTTGRITYQCISAGECADNPTCECIGDRACFGLLPCEDTEQGPACYCPNCYCSVC
ncbi:MAG: hypothetical protein JXA30_17905 [Deltaproteobacteria bacterium]|nr:hypothetical protein [Deltaproteobacteria bacterium]